MKAAYRELTALQLRLYRLGHLGRMASWDRATMMPPNGNEARAAAIAELETVMHGLRTDPRQAQLIKSAESEPLDEVERANLREIRRYWLDSAAVPPALAEAQILAASRCEHAWRTQRPANDWEGFLPALREVVRLTREEAIHLSEAKGLAPYDALLDRYEPGVRAADLDRIFGDLKQWLPPLIAKVRAKQATEPVIEPVGPFPLDRQRSLGRALMEALGFDFQGGRLDESAHPFCGGVPEDIRLTTRYSESDFLRSFMATAHETGHARYNQNLPAAHRGQPLGFPRSAGIHESQSLSFEMQLARSRPFMQVLAPMIAEAFGPQPAFEPENLHRLFTRVEPGLIRVAADECCYPLHVILRYEIERSLLEGEIECEDIPALWDAKMASYLDLDTRGDFNNGCMQDVHWSEGLFGYFPTYTLGAMCGAQWFAAVRRAIPDLDDRLARGDTAALFAWLHDNVWSQGARWETPELVRRASGEPLNPAHFRAHLTTRYLE